MTTAIEILERAYAHGASLWANGGKLEVDAPADFPEALVTLIRQYKADILEHIARRPKSPVKGDAPRLLAWAANLAESGQELQSPVRYVEAPLRTVNTTRVAYHARQYLTTICSARIHRKTGGWGSYMAEWWQKQEQEALGSLAALHEALLGQERKTNS